MLFVLTSGNMFHVCANTITGLFTMFHVYASTVYICNQHINLNFSAIKFAAVIINNPTSAGFLMRTVQSLRGARGAVAP